MWVSKFNKWHKDVLPFEKFLTERIIQRCDYNEIISNKHRTANGYTQLKELIQLCLLTVRRNRSVKTLMVLIEEATSPYVKQNVVHDIIIDKYFIDLSKFLRSYQKDKLLGERTQPNLAELQRLTHQLKIFEVQLDAHYYNSLKKELLEFDYSDAEKFQTRGDFLSDLIDLLIPYLVFKGYSVASISEVLITWLIKGYRPTAKRIFDFFHFNKRPFTFVQYLGPETEEARSFVNAINEELGLKVTLVDVNELQAEFVHQRRFEKDDLLISYTVSTLDPHNHIRNQYDNLLKSVVIKKERQSLATFNNFFVHSFWSHSQATPFDRFNLIALDGDSINVNARGRTLRETMYKSRDVYGYTFEEDTEIPMIKNTPLRNAVYYYNLALGSKSIENSLSLLWTALETIIPYRTLASDVECVQEFVTSALAPGSICRDVNAFAVRLIQSNQQNGGMLSDLGTMDFRSHYSSAGLEQWFDWLSDAVGAKERFEKVKDCSELLAFQYASLGMRYSMQSLDYLTKRIASSRNSIKYQLQRIYLHRNQIVHAGDLVSEYTNLWMHLEWYVGKLLAYSIINIHYLCRFDSLESAFRQLDAEQQYILSYLEMNRSYKIIDLSSRIKKLMFDHAWRAF